MWAHGRDVGLGGSLLTSQLWLFQPCSPVTAALPCPPGHKSGQYPQKNLVHRFFFCHFGQELLSPAHEGAAGQHRAGDSPGQGAQSPSTKLALSTAAGGSRWSSRSHTHAQNLPSLYCTYTECISNTNTPTIKARQAPTLLLPCHRRHETFYRCCQQQLKIYQTFA